jgi:hypothetical protein
MKRSTVTSTLAATLVALVACVSATISEPSACVTANMGTVLAAPVAGIQLPSQMFSSELDFSGVVGKLGDVADSLQANVNALTVHNAGDTSWLHSINVTVSTQGHNEAAQLAHYTAPTVGAGTDLVLVIDMDQAKLLDFVRHPVTLAFTINGTSTTHPVVLNDTMCIAVTGKASKSF